jgi:hypothetical protein
MKHFLPLLILFLSACSQNIGNLSIVSTQPTNISNEYDSIGQIQGESKINTNTRHPRASMTMINEAIQNALDISGADLITDATFERNYTFMFYFYTNYLVVTGEGWVKKKEGIKREKEIIEYDPDTGEPIDIPTKQEYPFDISTKKEGNDLARIASQFIFNPTPLQNCMAIPCGFIVFIIALVLAPGSDS